MELLYKDYTTFNILGEPMNLISDETDYGRCTVAEWKDQFYYLGDEPPNLESALFIWQDLNNRDLTLEEFDQTLKDNSAILADFTGE